jgi:hypothetical protein
MKWSDWKKYSEEWPSHILRMLKSYLNTLLGKEENCIDCLNAPCRGKDCFEKIREFYGDKLKPHGWLGWDYHHLYKGFRGESIHPWSNAPLEIDMLKGFRDGRFAAFMQEMAFEGRKNPHSGNTLECTGNSDPDLIEKEDKEVRIEVKSFTSADVSLRLKPAKYTGTNRKDNPDITLEETITNFDYWILVDRTRFYYGRNISLPYYIIPSDVLVSIVCGEDPTYTSQISKKERMFLTSQKEVIEYETVLEIISRSLLRENGY